MVRLRVLQGLLILMVSGPFVLPFHRDPIPLFWNEWWAGVFGLVGMVVGLWGRPFRWSIPIVVACPAAILAAMATQFFLGPISQPQIALLYACYLLWAMGLMILGRHLVVTLGATTLTTTVAFGILGGASLNAAIALAQGAGFGGRFPWIAFNPAGIYGNLAQANHFSHYVWVGVASAFYLHLKEKLPSGVLWLLVVLLCLGSSMSGSRSIFLYAVWLLIVAVWLHVDRKSIDSRLPILAAGTLCLLVTIQIFLSYLRAKGLAGEGSNGLIGGLGTLAYDRLSAPIQGESHRWAIARIGWRAFMDAPWLGHGAGGYAWASFNAAATELGVANGVNLHAHNFVLQALVEFGLPASTLAIATLAVAVAKGCRQVDHLNAFWMRSILGIDLAHALLEYPHWYSHFLGLTALLLGAVSGDSRFTVVGRRFYGYLIVISIASLVLLGVLRRDYHSLEVAIDELDRMPTNVSRRLQSAHQLVILGNESVFRPWAQVALSTATLPDRALSDELNDLCVQSIRFMPSAHVIQRCVTHMALAGRQSDAMRLAKQVLRAYPNEREDILVGWRIQGWIYPELSYLVEAVQ